MYISLSVSKRLALVPVLAVVAIQLVFIRSVSSMNMTNAYLHHNCFVSQGKYTPGSKYEKDRKFLIEMVTTSSNWSNGFQLMNLGVDPNFISATLQCRGDTLGHKCSSCFATAHSELRRRCPRYKGGIIWYDRCFLEIATKDTFGQLDYDNNFCLSNAKKISVGRYSNMGWVTLIDNLTTKAIREDTSSKASLYEVGEKRLGKEKVYGMVQCTQDISLRGCKECVADNMVKFNDCLFYKRGARALGKSCNFRYEFYPFAGPKAGSKYLKT